MTTAQTSPVPDPALVDFTLLRLAHRLRSNGAYTDHEINQRLTRRRQALQKLTTNRLSSALLKELEPEEFALA